MLAKSQPVKFAVNLQEYRQRGFAAGARGSRNATDSVIHAMIFAYCDDSSDDKREQFFACGAAVAHEVWWGRLEPQWADATKDLQEPFRATDCECQHGQFETWDKLDCDALMGKLVTLLIENSIGGFASVVPVPDFNAVFPSLDETAPYLLAVEHTLLNMAYLAARHNEKVQYWVERGTARPGHLCRLYEQLLEVPCFENRDRLDGFHIAEKWLAPLQAGDLLAREAYKHMANIGIRPTRKPVERLTQQVGFLLWNREVLEHIRERGWPDNPAALACWSETDNPARPDNFYVQRA